MTNVEVHLKDLILRNVVFKIDKKIIKKGKIKFANTKQFFIKFNLENNLETKEYELPYPYKIIKTDTGLIFDYCLSAFVPNIESVFWKMKGMSINNSSKIHEKYLILTFDS